jgi:hypothetical protein
MYNIIFYNFETWNFLCHVIFSNLCMGFSWTCMDFSQLVFDFEILCQFEVWGHTSFYMQHQPQNLFLNKQFPVNSGVEKLTCWIWILFALKIMKYLINTLCAHKTYLLKPFYRRQYKHIENRTNVNIMLDPWCAVESRLASLMPNGRGSPDYLTNLLMFPGEIWWWNSSKHTIYYHI